VVIRELRNLALWERLSYAIQEHMCGGTSQCARSGDLKAGFRSFDVDSLDLLLFQT
jgi:hypothetical protein